MIAFKCRMVNWYCEIFTHLVNWLTNEKWCVILYHLNCFMYFFTLFDKFQIFSEDLKFKYSMILPGEPYSLGCDRDMNVAVATTKKEMFVFNVYDRQIIHRFPVGSKGKSRSPLQISVSSDSDVSLYHNELTNHEFQFVIPVVYAYEFVCWLRKLMVCE